MLSYRVNLNLSLSSALIRALHQEGEAPDSLVFQPTIDWAPYSLLIEEENDVATAPFKEVGLILESIMQNDLSSATISKSSGLLTSRPGALNT